MAYVSIDFDEGRRCADVIASLTTELGKLLENDTCEQNDMLKAFYTKLGTLAADLREATEDCARAESDIESFFHNDGKRGE